MGLVENLVEGFAGAAGAGNVVNRIEQRKSDRKALSDEELHAKALGILKDVSGFIEGKKSLDRNSPDYKDEAAVYDANILDARRAFTDLYHPEKNPGALGKLLGHVKTHLGGKKEEPSTPGQFRQGQPVTAERMAALDASAAMPQAQAQPPDKMQAVREAYKKTFGADMPQDKSEAFFNHLYGGAPLEPKAPHLSDYAQGLRRFVEDAGGDPEKPTSKEEEAYRAKRGSEKPSKYNSILTAYSLKWGKPISEFTPANYSYINQKIAYDTARSGSRTSIQFKQNAQHEWVPLETTTTSGPGKEPVDPEEPVGPNKKITPGEMKRGLRQRLPQAAAHVKAGAPLFSAPSAPRDKAEEDYLAAVKLSSLADQVAKKPNDAVNQKRLAVALELTSARRFAVQAVAFILQAGWGNNIAQWANNPTTGALPENIMKQLIDGAHQNLIAAKKAKDEAFKVDSSSGSGKVGPSSDSGDIDKFLQSFPVK